LHILLHIEVQICKFTHIWDDMRCDQHFQLLWIYAQ
jgi:hypothetical protein